MIEKPKKLFISHSEKDKEYVSEIVDLLVYIGLTPTEVFCSSVPGFDISYGEDIYETLKSQFVDFDLYVLFILSDNYYESVACMNEMGAAWVLQKEYNCILLPGFEFSEVKGAVNPRKKMMKLDGYSAELKNSLKYLIDGLVKEFELKEMIPAIWERYRDSFLKRVNSISQSIDNGEYEKSVQSVPNESFQLSTDDEKIIVYYLITEQVCNVEEAVIGKWFIENEIHDVNIKNGFMLLADIGNGEYENHRLALDIETFREMMKQKDSLIAEYENIVNNHKRISAIKFQELWSSMRDCDKLLAAYISDEKVSKLGMRWMANEQIEKIREWEDKKKAGSLLSNSYEDAMQFFIAEGFVYESGWTEYNSPKEYTLYKSLKEFLWRKIDNYYAEIREFMNCNFFVSEGGRFSC